MRVLVPRTSSLVEMTAKKIFQDPFRWEQMASWLISVDGGHNAGQGTSSLADPAPALHRDNRVVPIGRFLHLRPLVGHLGADPRPTLHGLSRLWAAVPERLHLRQYGVSLPLPR